MKHGIRYDEIRYNELNKIKPNKKTYFISLFPSSLKVETGMGDSEGCSENERTRRLKRRREDARRSGQLTKKHTQWYTVDIPVVPVIFIGQCSRIAVICV